MLSDTIELHSQAGVPQLLKFQYIDCLPLYLSLHTHEWLPQLLIMPPGAWMQPLLRLHSTIMFYLSAVAF